MTLLVRAVVTGFGLSLGAAIFKKIQTHLGFPEDKKDSEEPAAVRQDGATDPGLREQLT